MKTPEEIKKLMDYCYQSNPCSECSYNKKDSPECVRRVYRDAYECITHQEKRITELEERINLMLIQMPKQAARIFLRVTDVRVEQLQDITDEQVKAEGVRGFFLGMGESGYAVRADSKTFYDGPIGAFANLWNCTIKPNDRDTCSWDANPWVWVITFEQCEKPVGWWEVI